MKHGNLDPGRPDSVNEAQPIQSGDFQASEGRKRPSRGSGRLRISAAHPVGQILTLAPGDKGAPRLGEMDLWPGCHQQSRFGNGGGKPGNQRGTLFPIHSVFKTNLHDLLNTGRLARIPPGQIPS